MQPPQESWGWVTNAITIIIIIPFSSRGLTLCHLAYLDPIIIVLATRCRPRFHYGIMMGGWPAAAVAAFLGRANGTSISVYYLTHALNGGTSVFHQERGN